MLQLDEVVKHYRVGDGEIVRAVDGVSLSVAEASWWRSMAPVAPERRHC